MNTIKGCYFVFTLLYLLRLLFLDADLWEFNQAGVQPLDELYYNEIGRLISINGWGWVLSGGLSETGPSFLIIPNIISSISFSIFGQNFYGLRVGYILMGLISGYLIIYLSWQISKKNLIASCLIAALYLIDFNMLLLSRSATTVIPCMLALLTYLSLFTSNIDKRTKNFFVGFLPIFFYFVVYANMPFLIIFSFCYIVFEITLFSRESKALFLYYTIGVISAFVICEIIHLGIFNQHIFDILIDTMFGQSEKFESSVFGFLYNIKYFFMSNMFKYNSLLLYELLAILPLAIIRVMKKDETAFIIIGILLLHYVQTIFLNNATFQKSSISYPIVLLLIVYLMKDQLNYLKTSRFYRIYNLLVSIVSILLVFYSNELFPAFNVKTRLLMYVLMFLSLLSIHIKMSVNRKMILSFSMIFISLIFLDIKYVYTNRTYFDKNMMTALNAYSGKGNLLNMKGVCLYNNTKSQIDAYDYNKGRGYGKRYVLKEVRKLLDYYGDVYFFGYSSEEFKSYVLTDMKWSDITIVEQEKFYRKYRVYGKDATLSMFHIIKK